MGARYIIGTEDCVSPTDRGLAYGDGLFETMAVHNGCVERLELHLDRLELGAERLELPLPSREALEPRIADAVGGIGRGTLKLLVTRGTGPRGYAPPEASEPAIILLPGRSAPPAAETISLATLGMRLGENEKLAGIKHLNRLEQVLGQLELKRLDADEGLMLSHGGLVIGGTSRNLFARFGERLVTPDLTLAGIAGVMRRTVSDHCRNHGIDLSEAALSPADLEQVDEIFMTNALVGIQSVVQLDGRALASTAMGRELRAAILPDRQCSDA